MSLSNGVKKLYPILADNDFRSMSPEDLAEVAGYKSVNSVDQVFLRNKDYFTTVGKAGNRLIGIPSKKKKIAIFLRDKLHCVYCNQVLTVDTATIDHISPNGDDHPVNMATSCLSCNNKKGNMDLRTFINDVLPEDRRAIAQSNITRITEKIMLPGKGTAKGEKSNDSNGASPSFSEENKLKRIVRQVVQSEMNRKRRYEYLTVHIIEKPGYWAWIEDGEETYLQDDNDRPYGTLEDILNEFGENGWRFVHMITDTSTPYLDPLFTSGKRFLAIFEKAQ